MNPVIAALISILPAYFLGSVNGAIITSKIFFRKDIREYGSGNPGLTNFYRVFGKSGALLVIAIDVIKTIAPMLIAGRIYRDHFDMLLFGKALAGVSVVFGHCFPILYKFKGGKGIMAAGTVLFVLDWRIAAFSWGTFIIVLLITRYVSLASVLGAAIFPPAMVLLKSGGINEFIVMTLCSALLIIRHKENIQRLLRGQESKFKFSG